MIKQMVKQLALCHDASNSHYAIFTYNAVAMVFKKGCADKEKEIIEQ